LDLDDGVNGDNDEDEDEDGSSMEEDLEIGIAS
jgi:hypothetical protein